MTQRTFPETLNALSTVLTSSNAHRGTSLAAFQPVKVEAQRAASTQGVSVVHVIPQEEFLPIDKLVPALTGDLQAATLTHATSEGFQPVLWHHPNEQLLANVPDQGTLVIWVQSPASVGGTIWKDLWEILEARSGGTVVVLNDRYRRHIRSFDPHAVVEKQTIRYLRVVDQPSCRLVEHRMAEVASALDVPEVTKTALCLEATCYELHTMSFFGDYIGKPDHLTGFWYGASRQMGALLWELVQHIVAANDMGVDAADIAVAWALHDVLCEVGYVRDLGEVGQVNTLGAALAGHASWWAQTVPAAVLPTLPVWAAGMLAAAVAAQVPEVGMRMSDLGKALVAAEQAEVITQGRGDQWHVVLKSLRAWQYLGVSSRHDLSDAYLQGLEVVRSVGGCEAVWLHVWMSSGHDVAVSSGVSLRCIDGPQHRGQVRQWAARAPIAQIAPGPSIGAARDELRDVAWTINYEDMTSGVFPQAALMPEKQDILASRTLTQPCYEFDFSAWFRPSHTAKIKVGESLGRWNRVTAPSLIHKLWHYVVYTVGVGLEDPLPLVWPGQDVAPPFEFLREAATTLSERQAVVLLECLMSTDPLEDVWVRYCERVDRLREGHDGGLWQDYQNAAFDVVAARLFAPVGGQIQACQVFMFACEGFSDVWLRLHVQIRVLGFLSELLVSVGDADGAVEVTLRRVECARELVSLGHSRFVDIFGEVVADASQVFVDAGRGGEIEAVLRENVDLARGRLDRGDSVEASRCGGLATLQAGWAFVLLARLLTVGERAGASQDLGEAGALLDEVQPGVDYVVEHSGRAGALGCDVQLVRGQVAFAGGDVEGALECARRGLEIADRHGVHRDGASLSLLRFHAARCGDVGLYEEAYKSIGQAGRLVDKFVGRGVSAVVRGQVCVERARYAVLCKSVATGVRQYRVALGVCWDGFVSGVVPVVLWQAVVVEFCRWLHAQGRGGVLVKEWRAGLECARGAGLVGVVEELEGLGVELGLQQ